MATEDLCQLLKAVYSQGFTFKGKHCVRSGSMVVGDVEIEGVRGLAAWTAAGRLLALRWARRG
jgi:hypothetical protein